MLQVKKLMAGSLILVTLLSGCGNAEKKETPKNGEETKEVVADPPKEENRKGMTIAEAKKFLEASEDNRGKEVTVTGYIWSINDRTDGLVQLNMGDNKLEGMQAASFYCLFYESMAPKLKALGKDALVTVTGLIADGTGGVELSDCKLAE